jgi:HPt (histidine-containing phosphotransfer) domain-containing protein
LNLEYRYNPSVASEELALEIEFIEELLEDYVTQTNNLKNTLYKYINSGDLSNLKVEIHKLKGVAENLRVTPLLHILENIECSKDLAGIEMELNLLYKIVNNLAKIKN